MRTDSDVNEVFHLASLGLKQTDIAAATGVGQTTISKWLRRGKDAVLASPMRSDRRQTTTDCPDACDLVKDLPGRQYAYLLGQYLGDGCIVFAGKGTYRLFVSCCAFYPGIVDETRSAIRAVLPKNAVGQRSRSNVVDVTCYSKHLPCLFPQHGPGRKHHRAIALVPWQQDIALERHPKQLLRGLIHSDGCRVINKVGSPKGKRYEYVRYMFSNRSADIRGIFVAACDQLGIESRQMNRWNVAVSKKESVATMDSFIGPKL